MKYKTIKGLCKYIAEIDQQDKIYEIEHRWVWTRKDFTEQDNVEIARKAQNLLNTIELYKPVVKTFADFKMLMKQLKSIVQYTFIGTLIQDEIIATAGLSLNWE